MPNSAARKLRRFYTVLSDSFGPQHWWPAESAFEVIVGDNGSTESTGDLATSHAMTFALAPRVPKAPAINTR